MKESRDIILIMVIGGLCAFAAYSIAHKDDGIHINVPIKPCPGPGPCPLPMPEPPKPKPKPWGSQPTGEPVEGGLVSPDGSEEIMCPLPQGERKKNVGGSDGSGLCVFTSIEYTARWSNARELFDFQAHMRKEPGGGYPQKVDQMMKKYAPTAQYLQCTNSDLGILKQALKSGRMCAVTYCGKDKHYGGQSVPHMCTLAHLSDKWAAIMDNNFTSDNQIMWMPVDDFVQRWKGMDGTGWAVILLNPGPSPVPRR